MKIKRITIQLPSVTTAEQKPGAFQELSDKTMQLGQHLVDCSKLISDINTNPPTQAGDTFATMQVFLSGNIQVTHMKNRKVFKSGTITITEQED